MNISKTLYCLILLSFCSCVTKKDVVYFQNQTFENKQYKYSPILKIDDLLSINVMSSNEENIKQFNLHSSSFSQTNNRGYYNGIAAKDGYLINEKGNIDFPVIGEINLAGLTRNEACLKIKELLKQYISDPIVSIQILNFKVTVLGDVKTPGTFQIPNEKATILDAIAIAGDLNISAVRKNVVVIREESNSKKEYRIDLTSKNIFSSPVFYLNQNDIIYIEPNRSKILSSNVSSAAGVFISIASLIITTINVISK